MPPSIQPATLIACIHAALRCLRKASRVRLATWPLLLLVTWPAAQAQAQQDLWSVLRDRPNIVVVMRHTEAGRGNATAFDPGGQCQGEVMLTARGRSDAAEIGRVFAANGLPPQRLHVVSSAMCRTRDTALLAFGKAELDPALREFLSDSGGRMNEAMDAAEAAIRRLRGTTPLVVLTHLPNIDALTGEQPDHHHAVVTQADDRGHLKTLGLLKLQR